MKKIIIGLFAFAIMSAAMLTVAHASSGSVSFNNDPKDLSTVMVADYTTNPCTAGPGVGCWKTSITANPGDLVSVQIYFHNTGTATSTKTAVALSPENSGASTSHTFNGVVAGGTDTSGNVIVRGNATIYTPDNESLSFVPGSVRFYPNQSTTGHVVDGESYLFSSTGVNVGDITPGWSGQGTLVADFRVSGSNNVNNNNYCYINSFTVGNGSSTININQGDSTTLYWNTTGANSVNISGYGTRNADGSLLVNPYNSTTYTLTMNGNNCSGSQSVYVNVNQQYQPPVVYNNLQPQAITTVANVLSPYSAQLNGIAVPNVTYGTTNAWFEYGLGTGLGSRTAVQAVNSNGSYPYSGNISGLIPNNTYFYRAVVQNQNGIAYGQTVQFRTPGPTTTYVPPTKVIVQTRTVTANTGTVVKSQASLFKLEVDSDYDHMCIGGNIDYTVNYQNISSQDLQNSILRITFPGELTYASSSQGNYDVTDRTLTISLGTVQAGEQGSVTVHAQVNNQAIQGNLSVITATMVYTNPITHAQEQAIAYSLITISNDCPALLGASVFGFGGFLPQTLLQWLLLILVILALIVLSRALYKKHDEPAKTA